MFIELAPCCGVLHCGCVLMATLSAVGVLCNSNTSFLFFFSGGGTASDGCFFFHRMDSCLQAIQRRYDDAVGDYACRRLVRGCFTRRSRRGWGGYHNPRDHPSQFVFFLTRICGSLTALTGMHICSRDNDDDDNKTHHDTSGACCRRC